VTAQRIIAGDCLEGLRTLPDASVHCCVTSPPYWGLRDYGHDGQIGLESTPEAYVSRMVKVFREVRRVLRDDGTLWLNLGDTYGSGKQLKGIPWRVAFALQADGWWLRQDIIWHKPNPMPESVTDRCTKAHEYVFLLTKSARYFYDAEAVKEPGRDWGTRDRKPGIAFVDGTPGRSKQSGGKNCDFSGGRNRRSVWTITTKPYSGAHFAVMPPDLVEPCILAGCPEQCCPVCGTGWERVTQRVRSPTRPGKATKVTGASLVDGNRDPQRHITAVSTLGWAPACDCGVAETTTGIVLDPFAGSGTTLAVAAELGRNAIGCELNADYIALAERRIKEARASVALFEGACA
jgi:DNA modification methylase